MADEPVLTYLLTRRRFVMGLGLTAASGLLAACGGGAAPAATTGAAVNLSGQSIRIFTMTGPFISGPIRAHAPEFEQKTGAKIEVTEAPFADLFPKVQQVATTGAGDFDVLLLANAWV